MVLRVEPLLLTVVPVRTLAGSMPLTNATAFFFEREGRLFLVSSRHVFVDEDSGHHPDRLEVELHVDAANLAASTGFSIPLYRQRRSLWRQAEDKGGDIDVAVIEIDRGALPRPTLFHAFGPDDLQPPEETVPVGEPLQVVGFPLGFHDTLHHLPVVRMAALASSFGFRFQGSGYFLTDGRTHRGSSGAPVVWRAPAGQVNAGLGWRLLGVHSARLDVGTRDMQLDEALGLNCAWYADVLLTLTGSGMARS